MSKFELMELLGNNGLECQHYAILKDVKDIAFPYVAGSCKIWYFEVKKDVVDLRAVMHSYLRCLLSASEHARPVPHFASSKDYGQSLDPAFQPKTSRRRRFVEAAFPAFLNVTDIWTP